MAIRVKCACGWVFDIDDQSAGQLMQCPGCGNTVQIPSAGFSPERAPVQEAGQLERLRSRSANALGCGIGGLVVYIICFFVAVFIGQSLEGRRLAEPDPGAAILPVVLLLAGVTLSILAIVFGAKGIKRENTRNRGSAIAGLVMGIVGASLGATCGLSTLAYIFIGTSRL
jgi:hypothetical protein